MAALRLLLLGATGAVGREVLTQALADSRVAEVLAPTRRPLVAHERLINPVTDFAHLDVAAPWWQADAVVSALGTTIKVAGSQTAFAAVDRDLVIETARLARQAGATRLALNSSLGASAQGNFYLRTKAQAEEGVRALGYPSLTIVRPSLIAAERETVRPGEVAGLWLSRALGPLIPRRYRPVAAARIASTLLEAALQGAPGEHVIESERL
ncbi:MAG: NAD(P)H-binding protein [Gammaproteobacteria bacterium]